VAILVYVLCALTSLGCAVLLWRGWLRSRARLLLWSALCFAGFFLNNLMLVIDTQFVPQTDLSVWRTLPAAAGLALLVYGLVWDSNA
jgi:hypothetical protein